jgi:hypothetical protein
LTSAAQRKLIEGIYYVYMSDQPKEDIVKLEVQTRRDQQWKGLACWKDLIELKIENEVECVRYEGTKEMVPELQLEKIY